MIKYVDTLIGFSEVPDEMSLCINISGCTNNCEGCHSPHLREDIGEPLTYTALDKLITNNEGISCICLMGDGGKQWKELSLIFSYIKYKYPKLKTALYTAIEVFPAKFALRYLDYIKLGSYKQDCGPLNSPTTNQRMKKLNWTEDGLDVEDITYKFQKDKNNEN